MPHRHEHLSERELLLLILETMSDNADKVTAAADEIQKAATDITTAATALTTKLQPDPDLPAALSALSSAAGSLATAVNALQQIAGTVPEVAVSQA